VFEKFEKIVEKTLNKPFSKKDTVQPIELLSALKNEMDTNSILLSEDRAVAPNIYTLQVNSPDYQKFQDWGIDALSSELINGLTEHAASQNYTLLGAIVVRFDEFPDYEKGDFSIETETVKGKTAPATAKSSTQPQLNIGGQKYVLTSPNTTIGRGEDCDIVISDKNVSRHHLEIAITPDGTIVSDLNSTNGTYVEGNRINKAYLLDGNLITIGNTNMEFIEGF
jgi:hypothetical protein